MNVTGIQFVTSEFLGLTKNHFTLGLNNVDPSDSYILKSATGLDPEEIISSFYATITIARDRYTPPERYYDLKPKPRTVSFKIKLNPNLAAGESYSSLRDTLYKMIAYHRGSGIRMQFLEADTAVAELVGFVTHFESGLFDNDPSVQITLRCVDSFLRSLEPVTRSITLPTDQNFSIDDDPSTAPHGFYMTVDFTVDTDVFRFRGISDENAADFVIRHDFEVGDRLSIKSDPVDRQVYVLPAPSYLAKTYLMDKVDVGSIWPMMFPDQNSFSIDYGDVDMFSFSFYETYWGI